MGASQTAFQAAACQGGGFRNHAGETHWVFQRKRMQRSSKSNALRTLSSSRKHRQWVGRNRELLEEVMINNRVNIEPAFVGMLDLPHDLPDHVVVRLAWRRLKFAIDP